MTRAEQNVELTADLYEARRAARFLLRDRYAETLQPYRDFIARVMADESLPVLRAALKIGQSIPPADAIPLMCVLAAAAIPSSRSANLASSLANRLERRFRGDGGTKRRWILSHAVTPLRRSYYALTPSERTTNASGSTGWPTPAARDGKDISRSNAFLSQRRRHSPSMATRLLERGAPWTVISAVYCLAMGYPSSWNETRLRATATRSCPRLPRRSSKRISTSRKRAPSAASPHRPSGAQDADSSTD